MARCCLHIRADIAEGFGPGEAVGRGPRLSNCASLPPMPGPRVFAQAVPPLRAAYN